MRQNQLAVSLRPDFFSGTGNKEAVARRKLHFFILLIQDSAALDTYKTAEGMRIGRQLAARTVISDSLRIQNICICSRIRQV